MATDQRNLPAFIDADATFRTWAQGVAAQLAAVGLVKTGDTGQVDLAAAARPAVSAFAGYEVYRFNDTLQATAPVFIKIEYGVGSPADMPSLAVTVGTATNGAGVIGGQSDGRRLLIPSQSKVLGGLLPSYCSGGPGRVAVVTNLDASGTSASYYHSLWMIVERTRGADGVTTGDGIYVVAASSGTSLYHRIIPFTGALPISQSVLPVVPLTRGGMPQVGVDIAFSANVCFIGKVLYALPLGYYHPSVGALATIQLQHLGALRTYLPLGLGIYGYSVANANEHSLAIPWE